MIKYILCCALFLSPVTFFGGSRAMASLKFELSLSPTVSNTPLTGRMFLIITRSESPEPRLQVARYGPQILGVDVEQLTPGKSVVIDDRTLGYPIKTLEDLPSGEYYIQGV
ncbi:MAG TPA: hypothetical protein EYQ20_11475, partial [candidate division Zixibacteria bacterium]|nr:hypothetical protein [candidate division Zixibacteria bacterium]